MTDPIYVHRQISGGGGSGCLNLDTVEHWIEYRDCRNDSAYDYGEQYADKVLDVLPDFVADVYALISIIEDAADD